LWSTIPPALLASIAMVINRVTKPTLPDNFEEENNVKKEMLSLGGNMLDVGADISFLGRNHCP